jgi:hypothetical protein
MTALLESNSVAVNCFWQSTNRVWGQHMRSAEAVETNKVATAIYQYQHNASPKRRRWRLRHKSVPTNVPRPVWIQALCWSARDIGHAIMECLMLTDRFNTCSVSKRIQVAVPDDDVEFLKFRVNVTNFCFSQEAARLFRPLQTSEKYALVRGVYRYLETTGSTAPLRQGAQLWGPAVLFVSSSASDLASEQQDALRQHIRESRDGATTRLAFDKVVGLLVSRYGG